MAQDEGPGRQRWRGDCTVEVAPVRPLRLALLGCGSVGSQVVRLLREQADDLTARVGAPIELVGVAVRRPELQRDAEVPTELLTTDAAGLVSREDVDLVVEVIGGIEPARSLILSALENGASVVTANKALLAEDGSTLFAAAEKAGRDLYFEAAVAGCDPDRPAAARVARRRQGASRAGHRQRHHELHPRQDGHLGRRVRRGARGGPGARLRGGRPDRRRRGVRRGREGGDPRQPGLPHPGHRRATSTARASPRSARPTWRRPATWAAWSSCWRSASSARAPTGRRWPHACTRR